MLPFSALNAEGAPALRDELAARSRRLPRQARTTASRSPASAIARRWRRLWKLSRRARASALSGMPPEIVAVDVAAAAEALGAITGEVGTEDVLDAVFREFCIGK